MDSSEMNRSEIDNLKTHNLETHPFDVVIIGGGPGGTAAAIACAQAGLTVALLEQACFPRDRPGETLHPGVEPILKQLGAWDAVQGAGFLRHRGHYVEWFEERRFEAFGADASGDWLGFQAWRADFDAILLNQARLAGVQVVQPCRALHPTVVSGRVMGVETAQGVFKAKFIIDATGSARWLARHLLLEATCLTPRLMAHYGYVSGECPARNEFPLIIADSNGWTWTARVRPNIYQWTRLTLTEMAIAKDWRPVEFAGMTSIGSIKSADVTWRMIQAAAGPGYFMVGDAAAVLDPASSHGVLKALMSGMMAAHLIVKSIDLDNQPTMEEGQALNTHNIETSCVETYRQWLESWFLHDASQLRKRYAPFLETSAERVS
jgi:flavin-dependent dehydrogenase